MEQDQLHSKKIGDVIQSNKARDQKIKATIQYNVKQDTDLSTHAKQLSNISVEQSKHSQKFLENDKSIKDQANKLVQVSTVQDEHAKKFMIQDQDIQNQSSRYLTLSKQQRDQATKTLSKMNDLDSIARSHASANNEYSRQCWAIAK